MIKLEYIKLGDTMSRKFKPKRRFNNIFKYILILIIILFIYILFSLVLSIPNINIADDLFIEYLLDDSGIYMNSKSDYRDFSNVLINNFYRLDFNNPISILKTSSYYMDSANDRYVYKNIENDDISFQFVNSGPLVYIYNTHPLESFINDKEKVNPTIFDMAGILKKRLESIGVTTLLEEKDATSYLKQYNLNYNQSYQATRSFLNDVLKKYDGIKLFIDLHRDGVDYKYSVTTIDDKNYAKVMFVIGGGQSNYQYTKDTANRINNILKEKYPTISRGLYEHKTSVFNQDLAKNMVLIELGGNNNKVSEVLNTIDILADAIKEYVYETWGKTKT